MISFMYTTICGFDNFTTTFYSYAAFAHADWQSRAERKACIKAFLGVKVTRYIVYEEDRKLAYNCKHEIWVLKLENPFSQT